MTKARMLSLVVAILVIAGATPFVAIAQTPATPAAAPSARILDARTKVAVEKALATEQTLKALAIEVAKLRKSGGDAKRLGALEAAYRGLKAKVAGGASAKELAEAHAKALNLLAEKPEALTAYVRLHKGPVDDDTSRALVCPEGTAPSIETSDASSIGVGRAARTVRKCVELKIPTLAEKASDRTVAEFNGRSKLADSEFSGKAKLTEAEAKGHALEAEAGYEPPPASDDFSRFAATVGAKKRAADAEREAKRLPLGWRIARDVGITAAGAVATYFLVGALSDKENADHNGRVAAAVVGAIGGGLTLFEF